MLSRSTLSPAAISIEQGLYAQSVDALPTFARWLDVHGLPHSQDLSDDDRVTVAWLQYDQAVAQAVSEMREDPVAGENLRGLFDALSEGIIDDHLGPGWFEAHVDGSESSKQTRDFLDFEGSPAIRLLAAHRVHELARRLYQLQSFEWFDDVVRRVATRSLSGAAFELDVVFFLHHLIAGVIPIEESGRKGEDYDIRLHVLGLEVPIEVKAKDDDTPWHPRTLINTIEEARKQLPADSKGIVFLRIPPWWVGRKLEEEYSDALADATRQTSRIGAVITVVDKVHLNDEQTSGHVARHYHLFNHSDCPAELWEVCLHLKDVLDRGLTMLAPSPPF